MKTVRKIEPVRQQEGHKLKVAAYCRVSTSSDEQLESLSVQKEHYESYIKDHENWDFVGIYFDEGISGTSTEKRVDLVRMLEDCREGKIEFILTKSISRFSRNLVDCLSMVRDLQGMGVGIYFEKENVNTKAMSDEFLLTMLSGIAETESTSISSNTKWAIRKRMEEGSFRQSSVPYGYAMKDGRMIIDKNRAVVIREIFAGFLGGNGVYKIANELNAKQIPAPKGGKWHASSVNQILSNERYMGDCLLQKTYTDSNYKKHLNHGEEDQFYVKDHHEAIISREDFELVQKLRKQHCEDRRIEDGSGKYQKRHIFSGKLLCGNCGRYLVHQFIKGRGGIRYEAWRCSVHVADKDICALKSIPQKSLENAFTTMLNKLIFSKKKLLDPFFKDLKHLEIEDKDLKITRLDQDIQKNLEKDQRISELVAMGILDLNECQNMREELRTERFSLENEKHVLSGDNGKKYKTLEETAKLIRIVENLETATEFRQDVFSEIVEEIRIDSRTNFSFQLKCGLMFREKVKSA